MINFEVRPQADGMSVFARVVLPLLFLSAALAISDTGSAQTVKGEEQAEVGAPAVGKARAGSPNPHLPGGAIPLETNQGGRLNTALTTTQKVPESSGSLFSMLAVVLGGIVGFVVLPVYLHGRAGPSPSLATVPPATMTGSPAEKDPVPAKGAQTAKSRTTAKVPQAAKSRTTAKGLQTAKLPAVEKGPQAAATESQIGLTTDEDRLISGQGGEAGESGTERFCTACGSPREPDYKFCGHCGKRLT